MGSTDDLHERPAPRDGPARPENAGRVEVTVERGLERYARGDLIGALCEWSHALVLDPRADRAHAYIDYVRANFEVLHERFDALRRAAEPPAWVVASPLPVFDDDFYDSIEVAAVDTSAVPGGDGWGLDELEPRAPAGLEPELGSLVAAVSAGLDDVRALSEGGSWTGPRPATVPRTPMAAGSTPAPAGRTPTAAAAAGQAPAAPTAAAAAGRAPAAPAAAEGVAASAPVEAERVPATATEADASTRPRAPTRPPLVGPGALPGGLPVKRLAEMAVAHRATQTAAGAVAGRPTERRAVTVESIPGTDALREPRKTARHDEPRPSAPAPTVDDRPDASAPGVAQGSSVPAPGSTPRVPEGERTAAPATPVTDAGTSEEGASAATGEPRPGPIAGPRAAVLDAGTPASAAGRASPDLDLGLPWVSFPTDEETTLVGAGRRLSGERLRATVPGDVDRPTTALQRTADALEALEPPIALRRTYAGASSPGTDTPDATDDTGAEELAADLAVRSAWDGSFLEDLPTGIRRGPPLLDDFLELDHPTTDMPVAGASTPADPDTDGDDEVGPDDHTDPFDATTSYVPPVAPAELDAHTEALHGRVAALLEQARTQADAANFAGAAGTLEELAACDPDRTVLPIVLPRHKDLLYRVYEGHLGDLNQVPVIAVPAEDAAVDLDHRACFLLSRVDGLLTYEDILDVAGMPRMEAYRVLSGLLRRGLIQIG